MAKNRDLDSGDVLPASWTDALQEFVSTSTSNLALSCPNATTVRIAAGTGSAQVGVGIGGLWRYRSANIDATVSGAAGVKDVFVTAQANSYSNSPSPDTDNTVYAFGLEILATGSTPTTSGVVAFRKIGEVDWSGTGIVGMRQTTGMQSATAPQTPTAPLPAVTPLRAKGASGQTAPLIEAVQSDGSVVFNVQPSGAVATTGPVNSTAFQIGGAALAMTHLADAASQLMTGDMKTSLQSASHGARPGGLFWWLKLDGSEVPAGYTDLIALLVAAGRPFGTGAGGRPNLPNCQNRVSIPAGSGYALGLTGGVESVNLTAAQNGQHSHTGTTGNENSSLSHSHTGGDYGHTHVPGAGMVAYVMQSYSYYGANVGSGSTAVYFKDNTDVAYANIYINSNGPAAHKHDFTTANQGTGTAHENRQPFIVDGNRFVRT